MLRVLRILVLTFFGLVGALALAIIAGYAYLQTTDGKVWLAGVLSSMASSATTKVAIDGLSGAPPFELHAASIRVADWEGTWAEIEDTGVLIDRRALLRGTFATPHLRASMLHVFRSPRAQPSASPTPLDLSPPHLPIDVAIDQLAIDSLVLDPAVLGEAVKLTLQANARLVKGDAAVRLLVRRTDGSPGEANLDLGLSGRPAILDLSGELSDPSGTLGRTLVQSKERQPLAIKLAGKGPIADWHGRLDARLGDLARLDGSISIAAAETYRIQLQAEAQQNGLLPPEAAPLIGDRLKLDTAIDYDGKQAFRLDRLVLSAAAGEMRANGGVSGATQLLAGSIQIAVSNLGLGQALLREPLAGRLDIAIQLGGSIARPNASVRLEGHELRLADISLQAMAASLQLASETKEAERRWRAEGQGRLQGLTRGREPLPAALGQDFDWSLAGDFDEAGRFADIAGVSVTGGSLRLDGKGRWAREGSSASLSLQVAALDRFAALAQLPQLSGSARLRANVAMAPGGALSGDIDGESERLQLGIAAADALLGPEVKVQGKFDRGADGGLSMRDLNVTGSGLTLRGSIAADAALARPRGEFDLSLPRLADLGPALGTELQGTLEITGHTEGAPDNGALRIDLDGQGLGTNRLLLHRLTAEVRVPDPYRAAGQLSATGSIASPKGPIPARLEASFARPSPDRVSLSDFRLMAAEDRIAGHLDYSLSDMRAKGELSASLPDLSTWSGFAGTPLKGRGVLTLALAEERGQSARLKLEASGISLGQGRRSLTIGRLALAGSGEGLMTKPVARADLTVDALAAGSLRLSHSRIQAARSSGAGLQFSALSKGTYSGNGTGPDRPVLPLAIELAGEWHQGAQSQQITLARLNATLGEDKANLVQPLRFDYANTNARLQNLSLELAGGRIMASGKLEGSQIQAKLSIQHLPLRPFGRLAGQQLQGTLEASVELEGPAKAPAGRLNLEGRDLRFPGLGETAANLPPLSLELMLTQASGRLRIAGKLAGAQSQLLSVDGNVPLRLSARPVVATIPRNENLDVTVTGDGRLERVADILPMGEDRITGDYRINLSVKGTPASPEAAGRVVVTNGTYLNQDYGTELSAINLELLGDRGRLQLTRLAAGDGKSGKLQGSGSLDLAASPSPAMNVQAKLSQFLVANTDEAHATVDADLRAGGSLAQPRLFARIVVPRSDFQIPAQLPPTVARLDVIEIDSRDPHKSAAAILHARQQQAAEKPALPVALDITVKVPGQAFVRGRGLDSEWRGNIAVTGDSATPSIAGELDAVRGSLSVLGKDFTIRRGTIRFPTGSVSEPWIDLLAEYNASDITAQATLTGSLAAPSLKLSSTPQLPQDEILSRVLFGSDASHITTAQGLQLAFAARSLASGGPGVLDRLRNRLGLDRLGLGSSSTGGVSTSTTNNPGSATQTKNGPTLSAGKYVAPGVFVGVEQGASSQTSRAKVEVEIIPNVTGYSSVGADNSNRVGVEWRTDY